MTRDEWDDLCKQMNLAWPNAPLSQNQSNVYFATLRDLDREEASNAIVTLVRSGADTVPPPRRILRVATDARTGATAPAEGVTAATTVLRPGAPPAGKFVVDAPAAAGAGAPAPGMAAPSGDQGWLRRNVRVIAGGVVTLVAGVGIGVGIAFAVAPNADKAYQQGKTEGIDIGDTRGYDRGYESGKSDGYDTGFEEGKTAVFSDLNPVDDEFYLVQYDSSNGIGVYWDEPIQMGQCVTIRYTGGSTEDGSSYNLARGGFGC